MQPLMLHLVCDLGPIRAVTAAVRATADGCEAQFRLEGRIGSIRVPEAAPSARTDGLWKTTCFEIFWQAIGERSYRELNLSPSGCWAAYDFDGFREGMRDAPIDAIAINANRSANDGAGELVLNAAIAADFPSPAQVGLSAVVEHADGALQYWALAFPPGPPDFHSEACRQLVIER